MNQQQQKTAAQKADGYLSGTGLLLGIVGAVFGVLMILCTGGKLAADQSGPGMGVIIGGITLSVALVAWIMRGAGVTGRQRAAGVPALLVLALSVGVVLASIAGFVVRSAAPATYHGRVGTLVTARLPEGCAIDMPARIQRGTRIEIECERAVWQAGGKERRGTVVVSGEDMDDRFQGPPRVEAYVIDDKGYSVSATGRRPSVGEWGAVPWWPLLPGLALTFAAGAVLRRVRWFTDVKG